MGHSICPTELGVPILLQRWKQRRGKGKSFIGWVYTVVLSPGIKLAARHIPIKSPCGPHHHRNGIHRGRQCPVLKGTFLSPHLVSLGRWLLLGECLSLSISFGFSSLMK